MLILSTVQFSAIMCAFHFFLSWYPSPPLIWPPLTFILSVFGVWSGAGEVQGVCEEEAGVWRRHRRTECGKHQHGQEQAVRDGAQNAVMVLQSNMPVSTMSHCHREKLGVTWYRKVSQKKTFVLFSVNGMLFTCCRCGIFCQLDCVVLCSGVFVCFSCWRWCRSWSVRVWTSWCWGGNTCCVPPDPGTDATWTSSVRKLNASSQKICKHLIIIQNKMV